MASRTPLVMNAGRIQQLQGGDSILASTPPGRRNILINGGFDIWQRNTTFAATPTNVYGADMWVPTYVTNTGVFTISQSTTVPTAAQSSTLSSFSHKLACTTLDSSITTAEFLILDQRVEGYNWRALAQRSMMLSFWVQSNLTGTYCVALRNSGNDRSYVAEYTISVANTWQYVTIPILASPSAGTWVYDSTGVGVRLGFALACGATFQTTAGAWNTGNFLGTSNQVNWLASTSNVFFLTQVQLEFGNWASPFEARFWSQELYDCQRYYAKTFNYATAPVQSGGTGGAIAYRNPVAGATARGLTWRYPNTMRAAPSITYYNPSAANTKWRNATLAADSGTPASDLIATDRLAISNPQISTDAVGNLIELQVSADATL